MSGKEWFFSVTFMYIYDSGSIVTKMIRRPLTVSLKKRVKHATCYRPFQLQSETGLVPFKARGFVHPYHPRMKLKSYFSGLLCLPRCPWSLSFDITLLICNVYFLNNSFTTYTDYACASFLPIVQEYRECDVRRLRDNGVPMFLVNV